MIQMGLYFQREKNKIIIEKKKMRLLKKGISKIKNFIYKSFLNKKTGIK